MQTSFIAIPTKTQHHFTGLASAGDYAPLITLPDGRVCYAFENAATGVFELWTRAALMDSGDNVVGAFSAPYHVKLHSGRGVIAVGEGDFLGTIEP